MGLTAHINAKNGSDSTMFRVQLHHLCQRERATDINVANKDMLGRRRAKDGISDWWSACTIQGIAQLTMIKSTSGSKRPVLSQITDGDIWEFSLWILDEASHHWILVETNQDHLGQSGHFGQSSKRVPDHWLLYQILSVFECWNGPCPLRGVMV